MDKKLQSWYSRLEAFYVNHPNVECTCTWSISHSSDCELVYLYRQAEEEIVGEPYSNA